MGPTNDVSFYEYKDSKELFNMIKNNQIIFNEVKLLKKLNEVKIGKKTIEQKKKTIDNLDKFYKSREEVINFLETILKYYQV